MSEQSEAERRSNGPVKEPDHYRSGATVAPEYL